MHDFWFIISNSYVFVKLFFSYSHFATINICINCFSRFKNAILFGALFVVPFILSGPSKPFASSLFFYYRTSILCQKKRLFTEIDHNGSVLNIRKTIAQ